MPMTDGPGGAPLAYDFDRGTRDPETGFVFLHGFGSLRHGEKALLLRERARERGWSCLLFDARGHGESGGTMRELTVSGFIQDAATMIDGPGATLRRIVLVGSSLGGLAALYLAARRPERIVGCVALAPAFRFAERHLQVAGAEGGRLWRETGVRRLRNEWVEVDVGWPFIADGLTFQEDELWARLTTPTLVIHGAQDDTVPAHLSAEFALRFPRPTVDLALLGAGDHRLTAVKHRVQLLIDDFATRVTAGGAPA